MGYNAVNDIEKTILSVINLLKVGFRKILL